MKKKYDYSDMVSSYFKKHLAGTKNVSINTIHSYRDTFVIFNDYLEKQRGFKLERTSVSDLSRDLVLEFLSYLESERGYSASSRNQRLATLKSFAKFVQVERPDEMALCQSILSIDGKSSEKPVIQYLSNSQTDVLMEQQPEYRNSVTLKCVMSGWTHRQWFTFSAREERTGMFLLPSHAPKFCGVTFRRIIWTHLDAAMIPYL